METEVGGGTDILTLRLDAAAQEFFEGMRQRYYPAERNQIAAHLTLFHTLPRSAEVRAALAAAAGRPGFAMTVTGLRSLGRGVAYTLAAGELQGVHGGLAAAFREHLTAQDRQRFMPHVVVQNKATGDAARALLGELQRGFKGFEVRAVGLDLWHYLGGPWELAESFAFSQ